MTLSTCPDCLRLRAENATLRELLRQRDDQIFHLVREAELEMEKRRPIGVGQEAKAG